MFATIDVFLMYWCIDVIVVELWLETFLKYDWMEKQLKRKKKSWKSKYGKNKNLGIFSQCVSFAQCFVYLVYALYSSWKQLHGIPFD